VTGEPLKGERGSGEYAPEKAPIELRVGHLLRINSYLDYAMLSMWAERRAQVVMGMTEASVRGAGPAAPEGRTRSSRTAPRPCRGGTRVPRGGQLPGGDVPDAHRPGPRHLAHNPPLRRIGSLEPRSSAESERATPTDAPFDAPVVAVWRGDLVESVHRGRYVVRDARGETLDSLGDSCGLRSPEAPRRSPSRRCR
jgi:hypothetical protein